MDDIIKELNDLIQDRYEADMDIICDYVKVLNDKCSDDALSGDEYSNLLRRRMHVINLISHYRNFMNALKTVKTDMWYNKTH